MANVAIPTNAVDLEGLSDLRRRAQRDDPAALADVAVQFEALFIGMMLESARSASLGGGLFDGAETEQYLALMDRQVALELARSGGFGFGKLLTEQLAPRDALPGVRAPAPPRVERPAGEDAPAVASTAEFPSALPKSLAALGGVASGEMPAEPTPAEFVTALLPQAKKAAEALGIEPRLLLAQAALETGWGRALPGRDGESSHNLFGIKAGPAWDGAAVEHWTLEHEHGVTAPQQAKFRAYESTAQSFGDYVQLISSARRYAEALEQGGDAEAYARGVTKAGYATDPAYADKWLEIYHGDRLKQALRGIDLP
jgi:flagellar protein FlgJ